MKYRQITLNLSTLGGIGDLANITLSSNGRTSGFGPLNRGSNPWGVTKINGLACSKAGDSPLQGECGEFDSHLVHKIWSISVVVNTSHCL